MISPYRNRLPMAYLPASRAVDSVGLDPMFRGRVSGLGSMGPRPVDPTETTFVDRGKIWKTETRDHPTYGKQTITYQLQVTVKNYVLGSGQVTYTTWGDGMYPGFNPTPEWKTVSETEFTSMFPMWTNIRNNKFGQTPEQAAAEKAESDAWIAKSQQEAAARQKKIDDAKAWRQTAPIFSYTATAPSGNVNDVKVFGWNKELGLVWVDEGPRASAENSMLIQEAVLASKSPEWVAWKSGSGSALPLLLGAAYLLLS